MRRVVKDLGTAPEVRRGRFATAYRGPSRRQGGLDWDSMRADYFARMRDQVARGVDDQETHVWRENELHLKTDAEIAKFLEARAIRKTASWTPSSNLTNADRSRGGRAITPRKANVPEIVRLYVEENMKPDDIAQEQGIRVDTVRDWLKKRGVWDKFKHMPHSGERTPGSGKSGSHVCAKGHYKEPGRACLTCDADHRRERRRANRGWM
jgi:DNA-directed RNA polymerase specialized sigma24 family protein